MIENGYATLDEVKSRLGISGATLDTQIERVIETVSRWIEKYCGRKFYASNQTRYYSPFANDILFIDDVTSVVELSVDNNGDGIHEDQFSQGDYVLLPLNAQNDGLPYDRIAVAPNSNKAFPNIINGVKIVGTFGFTASSDSLDCPKPIRDACILASVRLFKRSDVPFGISGNPQIGEQRVAIPDLESDPDIINLLKPYRRAL